MKFYGSVLFLALQAGQGRSENAETSLRSSNRRRLAYEWIAGYEPRTLVTDHAAIDLDQAEIENLLEYRRLDAFRQIYEKGGHSQSIARVTIGGDSTIPILPIPKSTIVIGRNDKGDVIRGRLVDEVSWTSDDKDVTILVEYDASAEQANYVGCQVGGLVKVVNATLATDGCEYCVKNLK